MTASDPPVKKCGCGRAYQTRADWERLPDAKTYEDGQGALCEQRLCPCGSHITVHLVAPMSIEELRRAVSVIDMMHEAFNEAYTAQELLRLVQVCWVSGWDVLPDEWTSAQIGEALDLGRPPRFEERPHGLHALGIGDCACRDCREQRRRQKTEPPEAEVHP